MRIARDFAAANASPPTLLHLRAGFPVLVCIRICVGLRKSRCSRPTRDLLDDVHIPAPAVHLGAAVVGQAQPAVVTHVDRDAVDFRLQRGDRLSEDGGHRRYQHGRHTGVDQEFLLRAWPFRVAEPGTVVSVTHGRVHAREELLVCVDTDWGGFQCLVDLRVVDAGIAA